MSNLLSLQRSVLWPVIASFVCGLLSVEVRAEKSEKEMIQEVLALVPEAAETVAEAKSLGHGRWLKFHELKRGPALESWIQENQASLGSWMREEGTPAHWERVSVSAPIRPKSAFVVFDQVDGGKFTMQVGYESDQWGFKYWLRRAFIFEWSDDLVRATVDSVIVGNTHDAPIWLFINGTPIGRSSSRSTLQAVREGFLTNTGGQVGGWTGNEFKVLVIQNADEGSTPTDHVRFVIFSEKIQPETRMVGINFGAAGDIDEVTIDRAGRIDWRQPLPKEFWFLDDWVSTVVERKHTVLTEYDKDRRVLKRWSLALQDAVKPKKP